MTDSQYATDEFLPGSVLAGQFRLVRRIGQGGMGSVYLAVQIPMSREVVVKVLRDDRSAASRTAIERFRREAAMIAQLDHPNIVQVYYFGETQLGRYFLAMEYICGTTLADLLDVEKRLDWRRSLLIGRQIASALSEAHHKGIIHRDLKPENVMLSDRRGQNDFVKLLDFGIARNVFSDITDPGRLTRAGEVFGTPRYISPEQARGLSVDHRSDLYAWGVVLYETLCGRLPFESSTPMGYLVAHMTEIPQPPSRHAGDLAIPPSVEELLLRCLHKNPDDRFGDAETLVAAIDRILKDYPATNGAKHLSVGPKETGPKGARRPFLHPSSHSEDGTHEGAEHHPATGARRAVHRTNVWAIRAIILIVSPAILVVALWWMWPESANTVPAESPAGPMAIQAPPEHSGVVSITESPDGGPVEATDLIVGRAADAHPVADPVDVPVENESWDVREPAAEIDPNVPIPDAGRDMDGLPVVYDAILQVSTPSTLSYLTKVPPQQIANFYLHRLATSMGPIRRVPSGLYFERDTSPLASITVIPYSSRWMVTLMRNAMADNIPQPTLPQSLFGVPVYPGATATARTPTSAILTVSATPRTVIAFYLNTFESMPDVMVQEVDDGTGPKFLALGHSAQVDFQVVTVMADPMVPGGEDTMIVIAAKLQ